MKKWIITTVLLICICAGAVAYAIIAPKFDKPVAVENITESQSYTIKQPIKGCDITIFKVGVYTSEGQDLFEVYMDFTNPGAEARSFSDTVGITAYQDGIELKRATTHDNNSLKIKDGATISVGGMYILRSDSDVTLEFSEAYMKDVIDSISYSIK